jgi:YD repeat-containing protein
MRYFFNKRGRAPRSRDPEDNANSLTYDGQNRVVTRATGSNETPIYTYDAAHNLRASSTLAPWRQQPLRSATAHQP